MGHIAGMGIFQRTPRFMTTLTAGNDVFFPSAADTVLGLGGDDFLAAARAMTCWTGGGP